MPVAGSGPTPTYRRFWLEGLSEVEGIREVEPTQSDVPATFLIQRILYTESHKVFNCLHSECMCMCIHM